MCPKLRRQASNLQPSESESGALPVELHRNNAAGGLRTHDLQIKNLLLCQLSYNSLVLPTGVEPASFGLKGRCISALPRKHNGLGRYRTAYAEIFSLSLYRLSYKPSETRMGIEPTLPELQSGAFPAWLPCPNYDTWNRTKITGVKIRRATLTPCRNAQSQSTAIMSSIGTSR